jgi:nucleoside-diphosphate-sugar epimerase
MISFDFMLRRILSIYISFTLLLAAAPCQAQAVLSLPAPGKMVEVSSTYSPLLITALKIDPKNPMSFDFILEPGDTGLQGDSVQMRLETEKLIKYFLSSLAIPEENLWVNLSPYENKKIIPSDLGQTRLGQDMLTQDYILKQLSASLLYPEKGLGKEFWQRLHKEASEMYGVENLPVNTFNKVWITADKAKVFVQNNTAFIVSTHMKVMMDEDYLAQQKNGGMSSSKYAEIMRELIIPEIEKEINQGKNFAQLRQIYHSMILATWYKRNLKQGLLNQIYADKGKLEGMAAANQAAKDQIYDQYMAAYKKGVFNLIKEEKESSSNVVARKYFSGGVTKLAKAEVVDKNDPDLAMMSKDPKRGKKTQVAKTLMQTIKEGKRTGPDIARAQEAAKEFIQQNYELMEDDIREHRFSSVFAATWQTFLFRQLSPPRSKESWNDHQLLNTISRWHSNVEHVDIESVFTHDKMKALLSGKTVAIDGAGYFGFVGPYTEKFLEINYPGTHIRSLKRPAPAKKYLMLPHKTNSEIIEGDAGRLTDFYRLFAFDQNQKRPVALIHMAGSVYGASVNRPALAFWDTILTINALQAMHFNGVNIGVFKDSIYTHYPLLSPYAHANFINELFIRYYGQYYGLKTAIVHSAPVGGAEKMAGELFVDIHPRFLNALSKARITPDGVFTRYGDGTNEFGFIPPKTIAEGHIFPILYHLANGPENHIEFDLISQTKITAKEAIEHVAKKINRPLDIVEKPASPFENQKANFDHDLALRLLGLQSDTNQKRLINSYWEFYVEHHKLQQEFIKRFGQPLDQRPRRQYETEAFYLRKIVHRMTHDRTIPAKLAFFFLANLMGHMSNPDAEGHDPRYKDLESRIYNYFLYEMMPAQTTKDFIKLINDEAFKEDLIDYHKAILGSNDKYYIEIEKALIWLLQHWGDLQMIHHRSESNPAMNAPTGGIDFSEVNLTLDITKDSQTIDMQFDPVLLEEFRQDFNGVVPVILNIKPLATLTP